MFQKERTGTKIETKGETSNKGAYLGGICKRGATHIVIFTGTMTAIRYCTILDKSLKPFIERVFPNGDYRFQQDMILNPNRKCMGLSEIFFTESI